MSANDPDRIEVDEVFARLVLSWAGEFEPDSDTTDAGLIARIVAGLEATDGRIGPAGHA